MRWIAPPAKDAGTTTLEKRLGDAADELRANSGLKGTQYSAPVLGLIFFDEGLPRAYTTDLFKTKAGAVFQHIHERYGRAAREEGAKHE